MPMLDYICQATQDVLIAIFIFYCIFFLLRWSYSLVILFFRLLYDAMVDDDDEEPEENINIFFNGAMPPATNVQRKKKVSRPIEFKR